MEYLITKAEFFQSKTVLSEAKERNNVHVFDNSNKP